jgi:arginine N-succinyltransferase
MFLIRAASRQDLDQIHEVAKHLNTVNLPDDRATLETLILESERSFAGTTEPLKREYLFVLHDLDAGKVIGTSMIHAQHGTRRAPHVFFDVQEEEHYSETLDRHFNHRVLRIGYNYSGPTEIGGLVLMPKYRRSPHHLGKLLSYVRFLFIGAHRNWFRDEVLSELLPPLEPDGTSKLWESLGRHFTGMTYQEADRISQSNKEFIRALFPQSNLYACLLPPDVQALIGVVGPSTTGVEQMLRKIGFTYARRIDPFDGGPHFTAPTDQITLIQRRVQAQVVARGDADGDPWGIVAVERPAQPRFVACGTGYRLEGTQVGLPTAAREALAVKDGDEVWVQPV